MAVVACTLGALCKETIFAQFMWLGPGMTEL
jgi:hypothetical protein